MSRDRQLADFAPGLTTARRTGRPGVAFLASQIALGGTITLIVNIVHNKHRGEEAQAPRPMPDRKALRDGASALQLLVAFAVVAAALLNPVETGVGIRGLILVVLIEARMHPRPAGTLLGIFG